MSRVASTAGGGRGLSDSDGVEDEEDLHHRQRRGTDRGEKSEGHFTETTEYMELAQIRQELGEEND